MGRHIAVLVQDSDMCHMDPALLSCKSFAIDRIMLQISDRPEICILILHLLILIHRIWKCSAIVFNQRKLNRTHSLKIKFLEKNNCW